MNVSKRNGSYNNRLCKIITKIKNELWKNDPK